MEKQKIWRKHTKVFANEKEVIAERCVKGTDRMFKYINPDFDTPEGKSHGPRSWHIGVSRTHIYDLYGIKFPAKLEFLRYEDE